MNFDTIGKLRACRICGRKMLVEDVLIGVTHTAETLVHCWDCLAPEIQDRATKMYALELPA